VIEDRLLGFDVRELWMDPAELWDEERRERFLLRPGASRPLSTDALVWPSAFDTGQGIGLTEPERQRLGLAGIPTPIWIGPNPGLWEDLDAMQRHFLQHRAATRSHATIAVSWFSDAGFEDAGEVGPYLEPVVPPERDPAWSLLGYDVADGSFVSALSNCGYSPEQVSYLRRRWGELLNASHLFADPEPAFRFRDLSNSRVPEHAPFFVYGLFLVNWIGQRPPAEAPGPATGV
jgi:hypothetical protein